MTGQRRARHPTRLARAMALLCSCLLGCVAACSSEPDAAQRLCTPGANVFCRCPGGTEVGTMQCLPSGQAFAPCYPCDSPAAADAATPPEDAGAREPRRGDVAPTDAPVLPDAAPAGDATSGCTALTVAVGENQPVSLSGDTSKAKAAMIGLGACMAGGPSKDITYAIVPAARGRIRASVVPGAGFDAVVYGRRGGCASSNQTVCADNTPAGDAEVLDLFADAGETVYLVVDGKNGSSGTFALTLALTAGAFCGDGTLDAEEACDDGNAASGDGCTATCSVQATTPAAQTCPGQTVHVWQLPVTVEGNTDSGAAAQKGSCGGGGGRDAVLRIIPHRSGSLGVAASSADFDIVVYARSGSCAMGGELACANKVKGNGTETLGVPTQEGEPLWLLVDGYKYDKGPFSVQLTPQ